MASCLGSGWNILKCGRCFCCGCELKSVLGAAVILRGKSILCFFSWLPDVFGYGAARITFGCGYIGLLKLLSWCFLLNCTPGYTDTFNTKVSVAYAGRVLNVLFIKLTPKRIILALGGRRAVERFHLFVVVLF